jgi:hypothetical protein
VAEIRTRPVFYLLPSEKKPDGSKFLPFLGAFQIVASPLRGVIANPEGEAIQSGHPGLLRTSQ